MGIKGMQDERFKKNVDEADSEKRKTERKFTWVRSQMNRFKERRLCVWEVNSN